jgi:twitching motility protein PilJ
MALSMSLKTLFGARGAKGRGDDAEFDEPTTQVKMGKQQTGYDPLAAVSIMEQMRTSSPEMRQPGRLWLIGHLPIVRQFQVLGILLVVFILLALVMLFFNTRVSTQATASGTTATEMQMLSQRLARGTSLAVQGNVPAFEGV